MVTFSRINYFMFVMLDCVAKCWVESTAVASSPFLYRGGNGFGSPIWFAYACSLCKVIFLNVRA